MAGSRASLLPGLALTALCAVLAEVIHRAPLAPFTLGADRRHPIDTILIAITLGILLRNLLPLPRWLGPGIRFSVVDLLPIAIVLLGVRLDFFDVARISGSALLINVICVAAAVALTILLCRWLGVGQKLGILIAVGTGICGGTAIAVTAPLIEADDNDTAFAVTTITFFGLLAIAVFPIAGAALGLGQEEFGVWAGTSVHATPQVMAAGFAYGQTAGEVAVVVKLVRVLLLAPLAVGIGIWYTRQKRRQQRAHVAPPTRLAALFPPFILGFVLLALANTMHLLPDFTLHLEKSVAWEAGPVRVDLAQLVTALSSFLVTVSMAGVGLGVDVRALARTGRQGLIVGLFASSVLAIFSLGLLKTVPTSARGKACDATCVADTFKQLAPIYRPSGEEGEIRQQLLARLTEANRTRWDARTGKLEILGPDRAGNFLVRVPATGPHAGSGRPPIALQAHMDMVLAAAAVPPGGDLRAYFREHPIAVEQKDGKIQSVGRTTSIGADNTVGCALMLRYALDPGIPHPPLELVFTVHEEIGLKGAREYDRAVLPLRAPVMVSLDGFDSSTIIHGSQGAVRRAVTGQLPAETSTAGRLVEITVSKLRGGHSGADIHLGRLNAVLALATIARAALADGTLGLVSAVSGEVSGLNKIPADLALTLAAPAGLDLPALRSTTEAVVRTLVEAHPGEATNREVSVAVTEMPRPTAPVTVLTTAAAIRLLENLLAIERASPPLNGVITKKTGYPNEVNTSSNLGVLDMKIDPAAPAVRTTTLGFMTRSFSAEELASVSGRMIGQLRAAFPEPDRATVSEIAGYQPWLESPDSWLIRLGLELEVDGRRAFQKAGVQTIGVEPSYFMLKFPDLRIVGMGATITDAHSVHEAVSVESIRDITAALDTFMDRLGWHDRFR
jgi:uncharacterized integral membrane protein (TIGR00698 family)